MRKSPRPEEHRSSGPPPLSELGRIGFFRHLSPDDLKQVAEAARRRTLKGGRFFFHQDDPAEAFFLLLEGRAKLLQQTPEGQQVLIRIVGPGEFFGGVAMLGESTYPVTVEAMEDCAALAWERRTISALLDRYPRIARNVMQHMSVRIREIQNRLREMATERVEQRVARTLARLARQTGRRTEEGVLIDFRLTRQDLAEMTGTTLYTVSRILKKWEKEGLLASRRRRLLIRKPHGLASIAEDLQDPDRP